MMNRSLTARPEVAGGVAHSVLQAIVCEEAVARTAARFGGQLRALVLTGSMARGEATFVERETGAELLGDAEFLLIVNDEASLPDDKTVTTVQREIESAVAARGLTAAIDLSVAHGDYLEKLQPEIFAYELHACGQAIAGDRSILRLIPPFSADQIRHEDAWRLLCNRMIELLEVAAEKGSPALPTDVQYRIAKMYLDMATSFLVMVGEYAPTYAMRARKLAALAEQEPHSSSYPFELRGFSDRVAACTGWKLVNVPTWLARDNSERIWEEVTRYVRALWRWELVLLGGAGVDEDDTQLISSWMSRQSWSAKARGWAYVVRSMRGSFGLRAALRFMRLAWSGSPRYWIYAAAAELFFARPADRSLRSPGGFAFVRRWLPVTHGDPSDNSWQAVAADVVANYKEFLTGTRA